MSGFKGRVDFGARVEWGAYSQPAMEGLAKQFDVKPLAIRVLLAAMARHDCSGHAPFRPRELAQLLVQVDVTTGELRAARAPTVSDAIRQAKALGFISEDSEARCIVLSSHMFQKGSGGVSACIHGRT